MSTTEPDGTSGQTSGQTSTGPGGIRRALAHLGWRPRVRPLPSLTSALGAAGGILVIIGVIALGGDQVGSDDSGTAGAIYCLLALLVALVAMIVGIEPVRAGAAAVTAVAVPAFWIFLLGVGADDDPTTTIEILTLVSWAVVYLLPFVKGRAVFLALTITLLWVFAVDQVSDDDFSGELDFEAATVPVEPAGLGGGPDDYGDDPVLDELWDDCDAGDDDACDQLYATSPLGSEYEDFGRSCGGRGSETAGGGRCASGPGVGTTPDPFEDPFSEDPFSEDPFSEDPFSDNPFSDDGFDPDEFGGGDEFEEFTFTGAEPDRGGGAMSLFYGVLYLAAAFVLDRTGRRGAATPFLLVGTAAGALGSALVVPDHPWVVGVLLVVTGTAATLIAAQGRRRGTAWLGLALVVLGAVIFSIDLFEDSVVGFGLLTLGLGLATIAGATAATRWLTSEPRSEDEVLEYTETGRVERPSPESPPT